MATTEPIIIPVTLGDFEQMKAKLLELKKVADDATNPDASKAHAEFMALGKAIKETSNEFKEATKESNSFADSMIRNEDGMLKVTATILKFEDQLYDMVFAGKAGTKEFEDLRAKTAGLKAVIIETDKEVDLLAENKGLGAIGGDLGQIGERLMALDFQGAAKDATILNKTMGSLGEVGKQSITGLVKTVGQLTSAFVKFGVALLANPIFLIVTAIVAIVAVIVLLMQKLGILQPILDAIGQVFKWIGQIIDSVVQAFNDFTDALGITDIAGEKFAHNQVEQFNKITESSNKALKNRVFALDEEMKIATINGKNTIDIEIEKQEAIRGTAKAQNTLARIALKNGIEKGILDAEEIKALKEKIALNNEVYKSANSEIKVLGVKKEKEAIDDLQKSEADRQAKARESAQRAKQYAQDRINAERMIKDLTLQAMQEGTEKEIAIQNEKYKRLIEDTKTNERLISSERKTLVEALLLEQVESEKEIRAKAEQQQLDAINKANELAKQSRLQNENDFLDELEALQEERFQASLSKEEREILAVQDKYFRLIEMAKQYGMDTAELEAQQESEITRITAEAEAERLKIAQEAEAQKRAERLQQAESGVNAVMGLNDLLFDSYISGLEKGSEAEQRAAKKKFEINKKLQIAQAVIQGVQAVLAAYASGSAIPVVGAVTGPLFAVLAGVATLANINKIKNQQFDGGGGGASAGGGGVASIDSVVASAQPSLSLFGGANEQNNTGQTANAESNPINVNVTTVISEHEITDTQNKVLIQEKNATL